MPKNIVIYSDGTGQDGGVRPEQTVSNVYKLYRASRNGPDSAIDPREQVSFYDPGLGTDIGATAMTAPVRFVQKLMASVTGRGITTNIADCYAFIIDHYAPGDRILLIGFSRGAYTVRCIANLLMLCGVPTRTPEGSLPLYRRGIRDIAAEAVDTVLEHGAGHPRAAFESERNELARRFRAKYGSDHEGGDVGQSNAAPHFIGVFDTVAALGAKGLRRVLIQTGLAVFFGAMIAVLAIVPDIILSGIGHRFLGLRFWPFLGVLLIASVVLGGAVVRWNSWRATRKTIRDFPNKGDVRSHTAVWRGENFDKLLSRYVHYARSANAIDETRKDFARVAWGGSENDAPASIEGHERLIQLWFAGNHSDIGGSYSETESRLSDIALEWMVQEATGIPGGLKIDGLNAPGDATGNPKLRVFPSCEGAQHCEVVATRDLIQARVPAVLRRFTESWGYEVEIRPIRHDAPVHPTVGQRFDLPWVPQCAGSGPYRPRALAEHDRFRAHYSSAPTGAQSAAGSGAAGSVCG